MQSSPNSCRHSTAISKAVHTASGSSPLQWKMGTLKALPRSEQYVVDRESTGSVVKPTWLFTMTWMVPPVSKLDT